MTITEAIAALEKRRDICLEMGLDVRDTCILIPCADNTEWEEEWEEWGGLEMKIDTTERGTIAELYLKGTP